MRSRLHIVFLSASMLLFALIATSEQAQTARVNAPAPAFTATDSHGQAHSLDHYKGKYVCSNGTTRDVLSLASTTSPGTCRRFRSSGPKREWSGSR